MNKLWQLKFSFLLVAIACCSGCAAIQTYPGERLPRDKVAVIRVEATCGPMTMNIIEIFAIDEKKIAYDNRYRGFAILPGRHKISVLLQGYKGFFVTHRVTGCSQRIELTLNAIAGETYALRAAVREPQGETNERGCLLFFVPNSASPGEPLTSTVFVNDCKL